MQTRNSWDCATLSSRNPLPEPDLANRPMQREATTTPAPAPGEGVARRRFLFALPAAAFAGLAGLFAMSLGRDPSRVPSALISKPATEFSLRRFRDERWACRKPTFSAQCRSSTFSRPGASNAGPNTRC